jgi:hypothetical protein
MLTKSAKPKKCKGCKAKFSPARPLQSCCSPLCALEIARQVREKKARQEALADRRVTKEKLSEMKTIPQLIKEAQIEFNTFIRERDKGKPCICCGRPLGESEIGGSYDCGHWRSTGSASHLRFDERNAHAQRKFCNRYGAGRAVDYRIGLVERIGLDQVQLLESNNTPHKWTREELIEIKTKYAALARQLRKERE